MVASHIDSLLQDYLKDIKSSYSFDVQKAFISYAWPLIESSTNQCVTPEEASIQPRLKRLVKDCAVLGLDVMLDLNNLTVGTEIDTYMKDGIGQCDAVFLILSTSLLDKYRQFTEQDIKSNVSFELACMRRRLIDESDQNFTVYPLRFIESDYSQLLDWLTIKDTLEFKEVSEVHNSLSYVRSLTNLLSRCLNPTDKQTFSSKTEAFLAKAKDVVSSVSDDQVIKAKAHIGQREHAGKSKSILSFASRFSSFRVFTEITK